MLAVGIAIVSHVSEGGMALLQGMGRINICVQCYSLHSMKAMCKVKCMWADEEKYDGITFYTF